MWPDEPYASARGSFVRGVPVPVGEPDASPAFTVSVSCLWLPYIRGALQQLLLQATWDTGNPDVLLRAQQRAFNLIDLFRECEESPALSCPFDFTRIGAGPDGWVVSSVPSYDPGFFGQFDDGIGWSATVAHSMGGLYQTRILIEKHLLTPVSINALEMDFNFTPGAFGVGIPSDAVQIVALNGSTVEASFNVDPTTLSPGFHVLGGAFSAVTVDNFAISILAGAQLGSDPGGGANLVFWGYGSPSGGCGGGE